MKSKLKPMVFFLLILVLIQVACAQERGVRKVFGFTEEVIGGFFARFSESPTVWMRMLLIIALFALLYYGALHLLKFPPRIAVPIALTISIIGIVGIPRAALLYLLKTYGGFVIAASILLPTAGLLWLTYKAIKTYEESRIVKFGFAFVWIIFLGILLAYSDILQGLYEKGVPVWVVDLAAFIAFIAIVVLLIWSFLGIREKLPLGIRKIEPGQRRGPQPQPSIERRRRRPEELSEVRAPEERAIRKEEKITLAELTIETKGFELIKRLGEAVGRRKFKVAKRALTRLYEISERERQINRVVTLLNLRLRKLARTPRVESLENRINVIEAGLSKQFRVIKTVIKNLQTHFLHVDREETELNWGFIKACTKDLIKAQKEIIRLTKFLLDAQNKVLELVRSK